ncbi:DUF45 domain-containing protein [Candidatus Bathyarchaeota archaeon]|nr:DUF45 domain-containing protein [Candidatus Bathyarchaeota archaeon]
MDPHVCYGILLQLEPHTVDSFDDEKIVIKDNLIKVHHHHERPVLKVLEKWMSQKTLELIKQVQAEYPGLREPTRISVTDTTRWGYTHNKGVIIYNWQLAALPKELAYYVIIHELVHLDYMNHQNGFKAKLANYTPNIKQHEKQLKKYQQIKPSKPN